MREVGDARRCRRRISGFDGVSIQTIRVVACSAAATASGRVMSTKVALDLPLREQVLQDVGGAVVDVARRDDVVARLQALKDRRHCGEPGAERGGGGAAFERGERGLEAVAVRVVVARVDVAVRIAAVGRALEGRREMDRVDHRAGGRVDAMAGVDGERLEAKGLGGLHVDATIPARRRRGRSRPLGLSGDGRSSRAARFTCRWRWPGNGARGSPPRKRVCHRLATNASRLPRQRAPACSHATTRLRARPGSLVHRVFHRNC